MPRSLVLIAALLLQALPGRAAPAIGGDGVCAACIRAHMEFLASDAASGRGSATPEELTAAT